MEKKTVNLDAEFNPSQLEGHIESVSQFAVRLRPLWKKLTVPQRRAAVAASDPLKNLQALKMQLLDLDLPV